MSDEEKHDLEKLGTTWAEEAKTDLSGLFGINVTISCPTLAHGARDSLITESGPVVFSRCKVDDDEGSRIYFVMPLRSALILAAAQAKKTSDEFDEFEAAGFDDEAVESYGAAMDICAGILGRVLDEEAGLPPIKLIDSGMNESLGEDDSLPAEDYRCMRFEVEAEGFPKESFNILFAAELAIRCFGEMEATSAGPTDLRIAIIDPSDENRDDFAHIGEELGAQILDVDPYEFGPESLEDLAEVDGVIVAWNLGDCGGLDLLEKLRSNEGTRHLRFAIASAAPTRAMVDAALRWGAQTVLYQPWEADAIRNWLSESS